MTKKTTTITPSELKEMAINHANGIEQTIRAIPGFEKDINLCYALREVSNLINWLKK